jgi:hypothetical protein
MSSALDEFKKPIEEWAHALVDGKPTENLLILYKLLYALGCRMTESISKSTGCAQRLSKRQKHSCNPLYGTFCENLCYNSQHDVGFHRDRRYCRVVVSSSCDGLIISHPRTTNNRRAPRRRYITSWPHVKIARNFTWSLIGFRRYPTRQEFFQSFQSPSVAFTIALAADLAKPVIFPLKETCLIVETGF